MLTRGHGRRERRAAFMVLHALAGAGMLGTLLAACGGHSVSGTADVTITLYNGQHEQTTDLEVASFERADPRIHVLVRNGDEDTFDQQIVAEGGRSPADVFYSGNSPALEYLQRRGLLARLPRSTLDRTPERFDSPQGDWVGVSARVSVLIYNPELIRKADLPGHVLQLADPRYRGLLALAAGETDFQPIIMAVVKAYGEKRALSWLNGIKANAVNHIYPDNETICEDVNRGRVAFGLVNQYYWYRQRAEIGASSMRSEIAYFAPRDPGYVIDVSGAGVLRSSAHKAAARELVAYLVSKSGQDVIANSGDGSGQSESFEYPLASGVKTRAPEKPFGELQPYPVSMAELGTGAEAVDLLRQVQLL